MIMRVEFGVGLFVVFLTMMLFMVMLFAMVLFVMVFLIVMLVTMLFVRIRKKACPAWRHHTSKIGSARGQLLYMPP